MLPIAAQTAGPNGLKFFVDTHGWPGSFRQKKIRNYFLQFFLIKKKISTGNAGPFIKYLNKRVKRWICVFVL